VFLYYLLICAEMTLGKHLTSACKVDHVWTSVLLTNGLSLPLLALLSWARGEFATAAEAAAVTTPYEWSVVLAGCVTGTLIGWSGWYCRGLVSATSYTLIGVANKMLTVLLAVAFLDKHASGTGIGALFLCIGASTQYEQAPLVKKAADQSDPKLSENEDSDDEEATAALLPGRGGDHKAPSPAPPS
jgi:GDP-mannose transporter